MVNHELSYKRKTIASVIHRRRLSLILDTFKNLLPHDIVSWADFGTSTAFVPSNIMEFSDNKIHSFVGFDHSEELLEKARDKMLPNSSFELFDMNRISSPSNYYKLVTCFETLEHVGSVNNALANLVNHVENDGFLFITVPNEVGFPGTIKLLLRSVLRKNAYDDFFDNQSYSSYLKALVSNSDISKFRKPDADGYGPHLGFDYRKMETELKRLTENKFQLVRKSHSFMKMNVSFLYKKIES